jgi:hypothetical protein
MILGSFFKSPRNRQYTYQPRFFNEEKERRELLVRSLEESEQAKNEGRYVPNIKGKFTQRRNRQSGGGIMKPGRMLMLVLKLVLVMAILYIAFQLIDRIYG